MVYLIYLVSVYISKYFNMLYRHKQNYHVLKNVWGSGKVDEGNKDTNVLKIKILFACRRNEDEYTYKLIII